MKKVLILGADSYIGSSFAAFAAGQFEIHTVNTRDGEWKQADFSGYAAALCCTGIAHVKTTKENEQMYYDINCSLVVEMAKKAKAGGVGQFIFLSSLSIYTGKPERVLYLHRDTAPEPSTIYGKSKLMAEQQLTELADNSFAVSIVRPPMVYGAGCRGNFPQLVRLARRLPIFPDFPNKRSMIYIENLCRHLCNLAESGQGGISLPHNSQYVNTTEMVRQVRRAYGKRTITTRLFNPLLAVLIKRSPLVNKIFGDLCCEMQGDEQGYNIVGFEESIRRSV